jgi:SAM-dependent methyltransferase
MSTDSLDQLQTSSQRGRLLERIRAVLACPDCRVPLESDLDGHAATCSRCERQFQLGSRQFIFDGFAQQDLTADWLNRVKEAAKKRLGRLYPLMIKLLSPVLFSANSQIKSFIKSFETNQDLVADFGSGTSQYQERVLCVDGASYPNVHVVCRLERSPFQDASLAGILSIAVLEHVPDPGMHVNEMYRVLRPGGRILCYVPFMNGYHASPDDFQRWTISGVKKLFREFEMLSLRAGAGPTSAMLWVLQEWIALTLSFGSQRLYRLLMPLTWILSPIKLIDLLLVHHPAASVIASGFVIEARKPVD